MTKYGRPSEQALKLKVVSSRGEIQEVGNKTVSDNAQRLRELFLSSEGSSGVIVGATLKIYEIPRVRRIMMYSFRYIDSVCRAIRWIGSPGIAPEAVMIVENVRLYNEALSYLVSSSNVDVFKVLECRKFYLLLSLAGEQEIIDTALASIWEAIPRLSMETHFTYGGKSARSWIQTQYSTSNEPSA